MIMGTGGHPGWVYKRTGKRAIGQGTNIGGRRREMYPNFSFWGAIVGEHNTSKIDPPAVFRKSDKMKNYDSPNSLRGGEAFNCCPRKIISRRRDGST